MYLGISMLSVPHTQTRAAADDDDDDSSGNKDRAPVPEVAACSSNRSSSSSSDHNSCSGSSSPDLHPSILLLARHALRLCTLSVFSFRSSPILSTPPLPPSQFVLPHAAVLGCCWLAAGCCTSQAQHSICGLALASRYRSAQGLRVGAATRDRCDHVLWWSHKAARCPPMGLRRLQLKPIPALCSLSALLLSQVSVRAAVRCWFF
jgi:hypothetical protein